MYWRIGMIVACIAVGISGCNSIKTTFLSNDSQGNLCKEFPGRQGVPVMVRVPTHVDVTIKQKDVWRKVTNGANPTKLVHIPKATSRTHTIEPVHTEQMFLMDPKRPVAGTGQFSFGFASGASTPTGVGQGILSSVGYKSDDETITQTANLGINIAALAALADAGDGNNGDDTDLLTADRVVAYKRFPIGDDVEGRIQCFLDEYINNCTDYSCNHPPHYAQ